MLALGLFKKKKFVSFGDRIVLLNSVLNAISIFYLSFMRLPVKVWRRLVRIQREFLWGGVGGGRKINWVSWKKGLVLEILGLLT